MACTVIVTGETVLFAYEEISNQCGRPACNGLWLPSLIAAILWQNPPQRGMKFTIVQSNGKHAFGNMTQCEQGKLLRWLGESSDKIRYELWETGRWKQHQATPLLNTERVLVTGRRVRQSIIERIWR